MSCESPLQARPTKRAYLWRPSADHDRSRIHRGDSARQDDAQTPRLCLDRLDRSPVARFRQPADFRQWQRLLAPGCRLICALNRRPGRVLVEDQGLVRVPIDDEIADFAGAVIGAMPDLAIDDQGAADSRANGDAKQRIILGARAQDRLAIGQRAYIVLNSNR